MDESDPETAAYDHVVRYLARRGYNVVDLRRSRTHKGYDLIARRAGEELKIEVKGCTRPWQIPDLFFTEFDAEKRLVADFLYVVYFLAEESAPKLCVIPREAIDPSMVSLRQGYRISGRFKKEAILRQYVVTDDEPPSAT